MHQDAVDAPKNANETKDEYTTNKNKYLMILQRRPDFMSLHNWNYKSKTIFGKVYRDINIDFMETQAKVAIFNHDCYKTRMRVEEHTYYENIAEEMLNVYKAGLKKIKKEHNCYSEIEILLGPLKDYTKKDESPSSAEQAEYIKLLDQVKDVYKKRESSNMAEDAFKKALASVV